jgi:hypothetical protein
MLKKSQINEYSDQSIVIRAFRIKGEGSQKEGSFTCPLSQRESNEENKTDRKVEVLFQVRDFKNFH